MTFIHHAVLNRVWDAIERAQRLPCSTSDIAGRGLIEDLMVDDWDAVETWSSAVIRENSQEMFRDQFNARDCSRR